MKSLLKQIHQGTIKVNWMSCAGQLYVNAIKEINGIYYNITCSKYKPKEKNVDKRRLPHIRISKYPNVDGIEIYYDISKEEYEALIYLVNYKTYSNNGIKYNQYITKTKMY